MGIISDLTGNSIAERMERAVIEIVDHGNREIEVSGSGSYAGTAGISKGIIQQASALISGNSPASWEAGKAAFSRKFKVQFNPNSLKFSARGRGSDSVKDVSGSARNYSYGAVEADIDMSVQLIFDGINTSNEQNYTVQPQVEGFIAALRNSNTRFLRFCWGKQYYSGLLKQVNSKYTMFSVSGQPISAVMDLIISLSDKKISSGKKGE